MGKKFSDVLLSWDELGWVPMRTISVRAYSCLRRIPVRSMDEFLAFPREDFLQIKNCGLATACELADFQDEMRAAAAREKVL